MAKKAITPIAKGKQVLFIHKNLGNGIADVEIGKVHHYNPATKGCYLITEGRPVYTINYEGQFVVVPADDVLTVSKKNKAILYRKVSDLLLLVATYFQEKMNHISDLSKNYKHKAQELDPVKPDLPEDDEK